MPGKYRFNPRPRESMLARSKRAELEQLKELLETTHKNMMQSAREKYEKRIKELEAELKTL
ncbi:MAG: hypothetical protein NUV67_03530, partial [archaeon]|nr:hypothetical protein [archaeon]